MNLVAIKNISIFIVTISFVAINTEAKNNNFSFDNLQKVPNYERYEFSGNDFRGKKMPIVFEYEIHKEGDESFWKVSGNMNLSRANIDENYKVRLDDLKILSLNRIQSFNGGRNISSFEYETTAPDDDSTEFVVSTIQGLIYLLRAYPFESEIKEISIRTPQQRKGKLNFNVKNKGIKKLNTESYGEIEVHHLQLSLQVPVIGAVIPKLNFYFKDDSRKTLVALQGKMPIAEEGEIDIELIKYEQRL